MAQYKDPMNIFAQNDESRLASMLDCQNLEKSVLANSVEVIERRLIARRGNGDVSFYVTEAKQDSNETMHPSGFEDQHVKSLYKTVAGADNFNPDRERDELMEFEFFLKALSQMEIAGVWWNCKSLKFLEEQGETVLRVNLASTWEGLDTQKFLNYVRPDQ